MTPVDFIHDLRWSDIPAPVRLRAEMCLLDLLGVAAAASATTRVSALIRDHAVEAFGGTVPMLFDARTASAPGAALAAGMTIDSLDGHDGYNPAKGHVGCPLLPSILSFGHLHGISGEDAMTALVMGYEFGSRAATAQHATVADYHTSGSWGAVTAAAAGARIAGLGREKTRHALGIAEYHGPRSQMMRCIDTPTNVKDGSGWGAMCGVSAVQLAARGFTGAPAITVEEAPAYWGDLGERWLILEQYFKPYPVCRWAQAPVEGVLALRRAHDLTSEMVERIEVETFHESVRLAMNRPTDTDEAQYSTSFPSAVAMVRGGISAADIADEALNEPEVVRLSTGMVMRESEEANALFPGKRIARVTLVLKDGRRLEGGITTPRWDATDPPSEDEIRAKYHVLADEALGADRAGAIEAAVHALPKSGFDALTAQLFRPISPVTMSGRSEYA
ncbi:MmgE/PrpD family protein [Albibacillus kandeliae]|uniref:MmgE/PrpD family protein n=1 Tax=Albibacillus kandeliae TaxID=2174228 RepID=UPI000D6922DD|nr:MmgE/PrpD family protein [Albibacillus kandeliae]